MRLSKTKLIIILAILVRLLLAVTTYHPDLGVYTLAGKHIAGEGQWLSFYDAVATKNDQGEINLLPHQIVFNYPPLAYLIPAIFYLPFTNFVNQTTELLVHTKANFLQSRLYYPPLLFYKLPMILADILIIYLLPKLFSKQKDKNRAQILWALNPIAIYVSSMMGQADIILVCFLVASLLALKSKRFLLSSVLIGLSALVKPIGLILIPILFINYYHQNKKLFSSLTILLAGFGTYLLGILPYLPSPVFRHFSLFADQISKSTYAGISIASGHHIPWFFIAYLTILLLFCKRKISLSNALGCALLSSLAFTHFHPQWLLWLTPWLIIGAIQKNSYLFYAGAVVSWLIIVLSFDYTLHLGMFLSFGSPNSGPSTIFSSQLLAPILLLARANLIAILLLSLIQTSSQSSNSK